MKRSILFSVLLLLSVFLTADVLAQAGKKKGGKPGTAKSGKSGKSKKGGKKTGTGADAGATTDTPPPPPAADKTVNTDVPVAAEDTGVTTPEVVADNVDSFDFNTIALDTAKISDGYYRLANLKGAKPFPFPKEDKNSVKFYKRLWREINLNDSENKIFAMPGETLIQFIMDGLKAGKIIAYDDDQFKKKLTYAKVMGKFRDSSIMTIIDTTGEITGTKTIANEFNPDSVTRFEIKEDIFFDKVRGRVVTEIIGIGPVKKLKTTTGVDIGDSHPFYLNFNQCRRLLAAREVVDPQRDIYNISFDDVFIQRNFKSLIIKESNPANLRIKDKFPDRDKQLREARRIENEILRYKRNLWKFNS